MFRIECNKPSCKHIHCLQLFGWVLTITCIIAAFKDKMDYPSAVYATLVLLLLVLLQYGKRRWCPEFLQ